VSSGVGVVVAPVGESSGMSVSGVGVVFGVGMTVLCCISKGLTGFI